MVGWGTPEPNARGDYVRPRSCRLRSLSRESPGFSRGECQPICNSITGCTKEQGYRYIYNHETKQFIDTEKCPIEWIWYDEDEKNADATRTAPLPLLLAMGNGRGGGDYRNEENENLSGSWCKTSSSIEITKEPIPGTGDYEEFSPNFSENDLITSYTKLAKLLEEEEAKHR